MPLAIHSSDNVVLTRVARLSLEVSGKDWNVPEAFAEAALAHFALRKKTSPGFFNGRVLIAERVDIAEPELRARLAVTDFANYLYWREEVVIDPAVRDLFGCALMVSKEGHVLLGRQASGNLNAGRVYPPGGFLDPRDVRPDRSVDLKESIARELHEETGLAFSDFEVTPGYIVVEAGRLVAVAALLRSQQGSEQLRDRILAHATRENELADIIIARSPADLDRYGVPPFAQALVRHGLETRGPIVGRP